MTKITKKLTLSLVFFLALAAVAGCSSNFAPRQEERASSRPASVSSAPSLPGTTAAPSIREPTNGRVQTNSGGAVTIEVEWGGVKNSALVFEVAMNTHSVDLDQVDLGKLAVLRDPEKKEYPPASWRAEAGGHHRSGLLTFPTPDSLGQGKAEYVELVIREVAGIKERVLKWNLGAP